MIKQSSKTKLTLWIDEDIKEYGKSLARKRNMSMSQMVVDYFMRLRNAEEEEKDVTPLVRELSNVSYSKPKVKDHKKYLEKKYKK